MKEALEDDIEGTIDAIKDDIKDAVEIAIDTIKGAFDDYIDDAMDGAIEDAMDYTIKNANENAFGSFYFLAANALTFLDKQIMGCVTFQSLEKLLCCNSKGIFLFTFRSCFNFIGFLKCVKNVPLCKIVSAGSLSLDSLVF